MKNEVRTSTGATKRATWALEPIAMLTARSILFFIATSTATQCSAALPTIATTITPMKNSERPIECEASVIEPTSTSDITPTRTPAIARAITAVRVDQLEDRRHQQRRRGEHQHRGLDAGPGAAEALLLAADPPRQHRRAHHQQD